MKFLIRVREFVRILCSGREASPSAPPLPLRISVYLKAQDLMAESAVHETSRAFAKLLVDSFAAHRRGQNAIQLTGPESWRDLKARFRCQGTESAPAHPRPTRLFIPAKLPPREVPGCFFEQPPSARWRIAYPDWSAEGLQVCTTSGADFA